MEMGGEEGMSLTVDRRKFCRFSIERSVQEDVTSMTIRISAVVSRPGRSCLVEFVDR